MTTRADEFEGRPDLVKKRARVITLQRLAVAVAAFYIISSMTLLVVNAIQGSQTRGTLIDCTTPDGRCYQDGQKRTAEVIKQLIEAGKFNETTTRAIVVMAAACADQPGVDDAEEIQKCVDATLKAQKGN